MFYTFKTAQFSDTEQPSSDGTRSGRGLIISRACDRCRRRKKRCNGERPCESCIWCHTAATCHYGEPRQRLISAKSSSGETSERVQRYRSILQDIFPSTHPDDLHKLSSQDRAQLIRQSIERTAPLSNNQQDGPPTHSSFDEVEDLESLQPVPDTTGERDMVSGHVNNTASISQNPVAIRTFSQDVNSLPLSFKHPNSYLGISMPPAVLRVIRWLYPECMDVFAELQAKDLQPTQKSDISNGTRNFTEQDVRIMNGSSAWNEIPLINAYFTYYHPSQPLLDEQFFRDTYISQKRQDARWNLLLNVVLALGSIAAGTAEDLSHRVYYERAKQYLEPEILSVHWEIVQALGLLGGVYLHHIQRPDEGIAMVGAAMRLALALGFHRDCSARLAAARRYETGDLERTAPSCHTLTMEMRSRIWWTLFNMDTWGCNGLGRPSMGRFSRAVTVKPPTEPIGGSGAMTELFRDTVNYCMISTRIEDAMALSPLMEAKERKDLDRELRDWFQNSSVPSSVTAASTQITPSSNLLRWRYHLSRIILHRPILLLYAMRKMKFGALSSEQREAIDICRKVADELIADVISTWRGQKPCQFSGTHATWILYQATMVPLLSLFSDFQNLDVVEDSRRQVAAVKSALVDLQIWSIVGKQSIESVNLLYEASQRYSAQQQSRIEARPNQTHLSATSAQLNPRGEDAGDPDQVNEYEHNSLDIANQEDLFDSTMLDDLTWFPNWDNIDSTLDLQDAQWRLSGLRSGIDESHVVLSGRPSSPGSGFW